LLQAGYGITNLVERATIGSDELTRKELEIGGSIFEEKTQRYQPRAVAILGVTAYRIAFNRPRTEVGIQTELLAGALLSVLPNPSGLNAHFTAPKLAKVFRELRDNIKGRRS